MRSWGPLDFIKIRIKYLNNFVFLHDGKSTFNQGWLVKFPHCSDFCLLLTIYLILYIEIGNILKTESLIRCEYRLSIHFDSSLFSVAWFWLPPHPDPICIWPKLSSKFELLKKLQCFRIRPCLKDFLKCRYKRLQEPYIFWRHKRRFGSDAHPINQ